MAILTLSFRGKSDPLMKYILLLLTLFSTLLTAQESKENPKSSDLIDHQKDFLNLTEESRNKFLKHVKEANRLFQTKRIFECLEALHSANKIFDKSPEVHNLYGTCYLEIRAFDKALISLKEAKALAPQDIYINFHTAELYFVTKEWQKSHDLFAEVLKISPPENIGVNRLIEFKILLCKIKLGQENEVLILSEKYDFQDDSPFYYYSKAAIAFSKNKTSEAEEWLMRANRIFSNPTIIEPWYDTLQEFGYIKSVRGNPETSAE